MYSDRIRQLRKNHGMTQTDLAKKMGLSTSTIGMYEQGRREPDSKVFIKLANLFNVSVDFLMDNQENIAQVPENPDDFANQIKSMLLAQDGLMFSGVPLYNEDVDMIVEALKQGINYAIDNRKNKE